MPIHNEEDLLPYSLPSVFRLMPDQVVLIFDRCFDNSLRVAEEITERCKYRSRTAFIELNELSPGWKFRVAFLRRHGFKLARNDIILNTDADNLLDKKIAKHVELVGKKNIGMIKFSLVPYPRTFQSFIATLVSPLLPEVGFGGVYAFSKKAWLETENQESVKNTPRAEDRHIRLSIQKRYKVLFLKTKTLHLRSTETPYNHFLKGFTRWKQKRENLLVIVIHSFIFLRPLVLWGYLKSRLQTRERK